MIITNNPCTACGACASICPKNCITIQKNADGFYMPEINVDICIECGACAKNCPANARPAGENWQNGDFVACWAKNDEKRFTGSSGGVFGLLAENILKDNGVVFGAAFSEDCKQVYQTSTEHVSLEELKKSKYVESYTGTIFKEVKKELLAGKKVLYCGTSCQVDGLKKYLVRDYPNLFTCDFLCHGVPAAGFYEKYIQNLEQHKGKLKNIAFRSKAYGWKAYCVKAEFENGKYYLKTRFQDPYLRTFFENTMIREACFSCKRLDDSNADLTIGDYWKVSGSTDIVDTNQGISLVGMHTPTGKALFEKIAADCEVYPLEKEKYKYAYSRSTKKPVGREECMKQLNQEPDLFRVKVPFKTKMRGYAYWIRALMQKASMKKSK